MSDVIDWRPLAEKARGIIRVLHSTGTYRTAETLERFFPVVKSPGQSFLDALAVHLKCADIEHLKLMAEAVLSTGYIPAGGQMDEHQMLGAYMAFASMALLAEEALKKPPTVKRKPQAVSGPRPN